MKTTITLELDPFGGVHLHSPLRPSVQVGAIHDFMICVVDGYLTCHFIEKCAEALAVGGERIALPTAPGQVDR